MRCPMKEQSGCKECDGFGTIECDHCGSEKECAECDGTGEGDGHKHACDWCYPTQTRFGGTVDFALCDDVAEVIRADALTRIPLEDQLYIVGLASRGVLMVPPVVEHEERVVFSVHYEHADEVFAQSNNNKRFARFINHNTPGTTGVWFAITLPAFKLKDVEAEINEVIARRTHAAA